MREVIADPRVRMRLQRLEFEHDHEPLPAFLADCGIFDFGELTPSMALAFVAARNLLTAIDLFGVPSGKMLRGDTDLAAFDYLTPKTTLNPALREYLNPAPEHDLELDLLMDPEDIPLAVPEDLMLRRRAPREFLRRMTEGELLRSSWVHEEPDEEADHPEEEHERQEGEDEGAEEELRPYGYLLLDASESMSTSRDSRDVVARGLAIAFLWDQWSLGNPTWLYLFRHKLSPGTGGENRSDFHAAVAEVLLHEHAGMTNLQDTLRSLAAEKQEKGNRVDIVLITDGLSHLKENPLGDAHLHTFLLGERPEELDRVQLHEYQTSLDQLKSWSEFFFTLRPDIMREAVIPTSSDLLSCGAIIESLDRVIAQTVSQEKVRRLRARTAALLKLFDTYREHHDDPHPQLDALHDKLRHAKASLGERSPLEIARDNSEKYSLADLRLAQSLEKRELSTGLKSQMTMEFKVKPNRPEVVDWAEVFRALIRTVRILARDPARFLGLVRRRRKRS